MKIEKLRNNHKKGFIIGTILTIVIGGALTFKLTHSKYRVTQNIDLGSGVINYKVPDFKIMAMYKNDGSGDISIDSMPTSGYVINESKTYCQTSSGSQVKGKIKTISGNHVISGLNKGDKCYLYFDEQVLGADQILANITPKTDTPDFSQIADTDEGVFKTEDGMYNGTTYYWRGAVTNNYVKFAGFCWRIIRINGDKSIRLIYDGSTCHANGTSTIDSLAQPTSGTTGYAYYSSYNNPSYVGWTFTTSSQRPSTTNNNGSVGDSSNAKTQLQTWYNNNLSSYATSIANGKYCNDREIGSGSWNIGSSTFYYTGYTRTIQKYSPTFNCNNAGDVYTLKVGLITADEVEFAGGKNENNTSYYLYNGQNYWTMSPCCWNGPGTYVFLVDSDGYLSDASVGDTFGLRPVINLRSDVTFSSGNGTQSSPYVVNQA